MGRFEKRTENFRTKSDPLTEADTALRAVTEELQIIQRTLLKSLQEDVRRLQAEKIRLADDIKRLQQEREDLLQGRQVSEMQGLVRQLAQVMTNHISSQLQSSLDTLANQVAERATLGGNSNENANQLVGSLDDTLTITFNSLQQELKNYQSSLSQQLSRMSVQQQQGETILIELINRLRGEMEQTTQEQSTAESRRTVIQKTQPQQSQPTKQQQQTLVEVVTKLQPDIIIPERAAPPQTTQPEEPALTSPVPPTNPPRSKTTSPPPPPPVIVPTPPPEKPEVKSAPPSRQVVATAAPSAQPEKPEARSAPPPSRQVVATAAPSLQPENSEARTAPPPSRQAVATAPPSAQPENSEARSAPPPSRQVLDLPLTSKGIVLIVLSTLVASLYNVAIKVIFHPNTQIFGVFEMGRLLTPTLGNSLLILMLRMLVVVPLMLLLAPTLHTQVWEDLQSLTGSARDNSSSANGNGKRVLLLSIISGCFLFLSQVLLYIAIGQITTGMAIALLFIYPAITGLLAWFLFRDRPSSFRFGAIASICLGQILVLVGSTSIGTANVLGSTTAIASGVAFALYVTFTRICATKLHPVSFTLIHFATMLVLSLVGLLLPLPTSWSLQIEPSKLLELVLSSFILGVMTLIGYLLNNIGIRKIGATRSAIFGAAVPALTVIFAGLIIQETLQLIQVLGVLLVTCGAAAFSFEKIRNRRKISRSAN